MPPIDGGHVASRLCPPYKTSPKTLSIVRHHLKQADEANVQRKQFGNGGPQVPVIGQGTWDLDRGDPKSAIAALQRGDDLDHLHAVAGKGKIACNQVLYHLQERAIEHAVIPWCEQHGVAVVAYSPYGHNEFPSARSKGGEVLQSIAEAHKATVRQVALSFLTRAPSVFAIPKASSAEHAAENAAAGKLVLSDAEIAMLDKAFPRGPKPRGLPMR